MVASRQGTARDVRHLQGAGPDDRRLEDPTRRWWEISTGSSSASIVPLGRFPVGWRATSRPATTQTVYADAHCSAAERSHSHPVTGSSPAPPGPSQQRRAASRHAMDVRITIHSDPLNGARGCHTTVRPPTPRGAQLHACSACHVHAVRDITYPGVCANLSRDVSISTVRQLARRLPVLAPASARRRRSYQSRRGAKRPKRTLPTRTPGPRQGFRHDCERSCSIRLRRC